MQSRLNFYTRSVFVACFFMLHAWGTSGQAGTAPSGYYPADYSGDMFTGTVTQTTDDTITLSYTQGSKSETFEAYANGPCALPATKSTASLMPLTKVPIGSQIEIFYEAKTVKIGGVKQKQNQMIGFTFLKAKVNGEWVAMKNRVTLYCSQAGSFLTFKAF
jgi:hypothetical protein